MAQKLWHARRIWDSDLDIEELIGPIGVGVPHIHKGAIAHCQAVQPISHLQALHEVLSVAVESPGVASMLILVSYHTTLSAPD